ncbi:MULTISPECIES: DUF1918 domain-containing protein [Nocardia]|uniref:DUF1918 domain-containing protein n=1 Tax=Nocardia TaxID=1817 RepID=UPI0013005771|nr:MULTISPECIES: DUF1918 domain-containing protein [Nocardia]
MHANPGDWLIVEGRVVGETVRRGLIEEVQGADGGPPFFVHWLDNDHRALVYPGPDSHILSARQLRDQERVDADRLSSIQRELATRARKSSSPESRA